MNRARLYTVIALVILVVGGWFFFRGGIGGGQGGAYPPTLVTAVKADHRNIPVLISAFGSLRSLESAELTSEKADIVTGIYFKEGQTVPKGTVVITLDDKNEKATLAKAIAEQNLAQLDYDRIATLYKKGAISLQELDKVTASLAQHKAGTDIARAELDKTQIIAPFDAQLGARKISMGQYVKPGDTLVSAVNRQSLKVEFSVPERYLAKLKVGLPVNLTSVAFSGRQFPGVVDYVSPSINPGTRTVELEATVDNSDRSLSPGLSVQVNLQLGTEENALSIPEESLVATVEGQNVFIVQDGKAVSTAVELGTRANGMVSIIKGLKAGDVVVTQGQQKLRDGAPVSILENKENNSDKKPAAAKKNEKGQGAH